VGWVNHGDVFEVNTTIHISARYHTEFFFFFFWKGLSSVVENERCIGLNDAWGGDMSIYIPPSYMVLLLFINAHA
jgi:hypothetical protein